VELARIALTTAKAAKARTQAAAARCLFFFFFFPVGGASFHVSLGKGAKHALMHAWIRATTAAAKPQPG